MDLLTSHFANGCQRFGEKTEFPSAEKAKDMSDSQKCLKC